MKLSDYQIVSVIKTYVRSMRGKMDSEENPGQGPDDTTGHAVPADGIKKMLYERIEERMTEKLKKHETE